MKNSKIKINALYMITTKFQWKHPINVICDKTSSQNDRILLNPPTRNKSKSNTWTKVENINAIGPCNQTMIVAAPSPPSPLQLLLGLGCLRLGSLHLGADVLSGEGGGHGRQPVDQHMVSEAVTPAAAQQQRGQGGVIHRPGDVHPEPDNKQHQQPCKYRVTVNNRWKVMSTKETPRSDCQRRFLTGGGRYVPDQLQ